MDAASLLAGRSLVGMPTARLGALSYLLLLHCLAATCLLLLPSAGLAVTSLCHQLVRM